MSVQARSTYQGQLSSTYFPDNTTELISEADLRNSLTNLSDSTVFKRDDAYLRIEDVTTGTQPNYVVTLTNEYPGSYNARIPILFRAHATNTGAATLNVNSLGAKNIRRPNGDATQSGDIVQDQLYIVNYISGDDRFLIVPGFGGGATIPENYQRANTNITISQAGTYVFYGSTARTWTINDDISGAIYIYVAQASADLTLSGNINSSHPGVMYAGTAHQRFIWNSDDSEYIF